MASPPLARMSAATLAAPFSRISATIAFAPSAANRRASASPMPWAPPVTIATLSFSRMCAPRISGREHDASISSAEPSNANRSTLEAGIGDEQEKRKGGGMMTRTEKEKMLAGELYNAGAPELQAEMAITYKWLARYNAALGASASDLRELLPERLAAVGEGAMIRPPFPCDYGFNISLGTNVFLNFNCVILDVVEVTIGDRTQIGQIGR